LICICYAIKYYKLSFNRPEKMKNYYLLITESYFDPLTAQTEFKRYCDIYHSIEDVVKTIPIVANICIDLWYRHSFISGNNIKMHNQNTGYNIEIHVKNFCAFLDHKTIHDFIIYYMHNEHNKNCIDVMTSESWESQNTRA
jgi:hypothetical protein